MKSSGLPSGSGRSYDLTGQGVDPKDRVEVLKLLELAQNAESRLSEPRRIELLQQALRQDPGDPNVYYQLGAKYEKAGRYPEAMQLYRAALRNGIENSRLHSRIADLLVRSGNKDEAIPEYENAAQLNPADVESQPNLATAYLETRRLPDAQRVYK